MAYDKTRKKPVLKLKQTQKAYKKYKKDINNFIMAIVKVRTKLDSVWSKIWTVTEELANTKWSLFEGEVYFLKCNLVAKR